MNKRTFRSIWAVFSGILVNVILSVTTDHILESNGVFTPPDQGLFTTWMLVTALAYRLVYTIVGGYVAAALSPDKPMRHVMILGIIGTVLGCIGVVVGWDLAPHWYPIALVVTAIPFTWFGGRLRVK